MEQHTWRKNLIAAIERTERITIELLTNDWLRFAGSSLPSGTRAADDSLFKALTSRSSTPRRASAYTPGLHPRLGLPLTRPPDDPSRPRSDAFAASARPRQGRRRRGQSRVRRVLWPRKRPVPPDRIPGQGAIRLAVGFESRRNPLCCLRLVMHQQRGCHEMMQSVAIPLFTPARASLSPAMSYAPAKDEALRPF